MKNILLYNTYTTMHELLELKNIFKTIHSMLMDQQELLDELKEEIEELKNSQACTQMEISRLSSLDKVVESMQTKQKDKAQREKSILNHFDLMSEIRALK